MNFNLFKSLLINKLGTLVFAGKRVPNVVNSRLLTKQSMEQSENQVKLYDAGDLTDVHSLAECHLKWAQLLIRQVKKNLELNQTPDGLDLLELSDYMVNTFAEDHKVKSEMYEAEWRAQS